jgi:hypothetical protein
MLFLLDKKRHNCFTSPYYSPTARRNWSEIGGSYRNNGEDVITTKLKTTGAGELPSHISPSSRDWKVANAGWMLSNSSNFRKSLASKPPKSLHLFN